jgi:hypothetical protein
MAKLVVGKSVWTTLVAADDPPAIVAARDALATRYQVEFIDDDEYFKLLNSLCKTVGTAKKEKGE